MCTDNAPTVENVFCTDADFGDAFASDKAQTFENVFFSECVLSRMCLVRMPTLEMCFGGAFESDNALTFENVFFVRFVFWSRFSKM